MPAVAALLALALVAAIAAGGWVVWRRPTFALPVFVIGLALHNLLLMWLVASDAPTISVRAIQSWKELYLGLLAVRLVAHVVESGGVAYLRSTFREWGRLPLVPRALDIAVLVFAVVLVVYAVLPSPPLPQPTPTIVQRLLSFRTLILIPALYLFGRVFHPVTPREQWVVAVSPVLVAALVSVAGLLELWFLPTRFWRDMGIVRFDLFQGFDYGGPGGLPSNFFQSTSSGLALRRMVSTYLSPLGIAYTGILVVPLAAAAALAARRYRAWAWTAFVLVVVGVALSMTRLALACVAGEAILLAMVYRRRSMIMACAFTLLAVSAAVLVYPNYGPMVDFSLVDRRPPAGDGLLAIGNPNPSPDQGGSQAPAASAGAATPAAPGNVSGDIVNRMLTGDDASIQAHVKAVQTGTEFVLAHPLGIGLGASVSRYGSAPGPNESALFQVGGELGLLGLIPFLFAYVGLVLAGWYLILKRQANPRAAAVPLAVAIGGLALAPIVLTSQVWGDFSVTFLFWWLAGACITGWRARGELW